MLLIVWIVFATVIMTAGVKFVQLERRSDEVAEYLASVKDENLDH